MEQPPVFSNSGPAEADRPAGGRSIVSAYPSADDTLLPGAIAPITDAHHGGSGARAERTIGVAIAIPEPYGGELQRWRSAFGDPLAEAIPTHVTLVPPTRVPAPMLPTIERHLLAVAESQRPFGMRLHGTATFRPVSPVVFVAVAEGISSCERLADRVRSGPLSRDLQFPYHPHVTVAHDLPEQILDKAYSELDGYECAFTVHAFSLFEHGADQVWRPQRDFALGGPLLGPVPDYR